MGFVNVQGMGSCGEKNVNTDLDDRDELWVACPLLLIALSHSLVEGLTGRRHSYNTYMESFGHLHARNTHMFAVVYSHPRIV